MSSASYRVTRATVDHLPQLVPLWQSLRLPATELDKRLTEFQVAESPDGKVLGAVGLQIAGKQARIHSEAFADFALADQLRPLLWERLQSVANNHGLTRLWTQEDAPFWSRSGLSPANADALKKLPEPWQRPAATWLTLQLREEAAPGFSVEKEFDLFMEAEKQRTAQAFEQAKMLKLIATLIALGLVLFVIGAGVLLFKKTPAAPLP